MPPDCNICIANKISTTQITCMIGKCASVGMDWGWAYVRGCGKQTSTTSSSQHSSWPHSTMHWEAQEVTQSDWDGTYLWVGHLRILVGKSVCDLSNLTQLIKGQQKTEPMSQTIAGSTKCKFPHPTDHFKFTFDRNTDNRNILFVSFCSTQATVLAERDSRRAANIINLRSAFELEQNNYESPSAPLWRCFSHLRNHQSWSWHCSAPFPVSPSPPITRVSSAPVHLMICLASSLPKQPQSHVTFAFI